MAKSVNMAVLVLLVAVVAATIHCSAAQTVHVVGGDMGWGIPDGGFATYTTWAATQNFTVGDILEFNFTTGSHDVAQVTREAFLLCNTTIPTISLTNTGPANITLNTTGEYYFFCTLNGHCDAGQRLAINVTGAPSPSSPPPASAPAPAPATTPTPKSAPSPAPSTSTKTVHVVGGDMGWGIPDGGFATYTTWAATQNFTVGDILEFNFTTGSHDVAQVTREAFLLCNTTIPTISLTNTGPANITLNTTGEYYFFCTLNGHCEAGQRLALNVTGALSPSSPPAAAPGPATTSPTSAPTPSTSSTPPPSSNTASPPPPGSSAPSFTAAAGFSATFLSIAVAYLLY